MLSPLVVLLLPALAVLLSFVLLLGFPTLRIRDHRLMLSFSGAFLLGITLFELLPDVFLRSNAQMAGVFIAAGILLQITLEFFSRGAEHGHRHHQNAREGFPLLLFLSLALHAFLEGIPLLANQPVVWAISVHKVPVALILGSFLLDSGLSRAGCWMFMGLFALMTPLGAMMGALPQLQGIYEYLLAVVIGMILHVSTIILFESAKEHTINLKRFGVILLGMLLAYLL